MLKKIGLVAVLAALISVVVATTAWGSAKSPARPRRVRQQMQVSSAARPARSAWRARSRARLPISVTSRSVGPSTSSKRPGTRSIPTRGSSWSWATRSLASNGIPRRQGGQVVRLELEDPGRSRPAGSQEVVASTTAYKQGEPRPRLGLRDPRLTRADGTPRGDHARVLLPDGAERRPAGRQRRDVHPQQAEEDEGPDHRRLGGVQQGLPIR